MLRVHQWAKNVLIAVPAVLANDLDRPATLIAIALAFCRFCLAASAIYILNDLIDLPLDRRHATKSQALHRLRRSVHSGALAIAGALDAGGDQRQPVSAARCSSWFLAAMPC